MRKTFALILALIFAAAPAYPSYNPSYIAIEKEDDILDAAEEEAIELAVKRPLRLERNSYMIGDWNGKREELAKKGVTFSSTFTVDELGNVSGGMKQAARFDSSMGWDVNFDLEKFAGLIGTQFHISGLWRQGQNLSKAAIGNDLVVSTIYGHEQFRFYFLYLEKDLLDRRLNIRIGRIAAGDDFVASPLYGTFVSNAVDGVPISVPINLFFTVYPTATWGARTRFYLNKDFYILSALYNGDKGVEHDNMYGLDFSLRLKQGIAFAQELAYVPADGVGPAGLPGHYKGGIYYNGAVKRDLYSDINGNSYAVTGLDRKKHIGDYNIYIHADQMIYREKGTKDQGLTPLAVATIGPDNMNKFPFFLMGGLVYKGLVPKRDDDVTGFEIVYAKYSDKIKESQQSVGSNPQKYEMMFEFTHKIMITKWMYMQPDLQYIIQPGGTGDIDDALVLGFQFGLTF
ncbi:MAG: carbohydrate porin [Candidatus Omnitrophota bacterium]|jgi:porin